MNVIREEKLRFTKEPYIEVSGHRKLESIQFGRFSGEEIRKSAEVQVWNDRIYGHDIKPVANGLLDPRMGPANRIGICTTCHGNFDQCPGHFGYLKLTLPVLNIGFFNSILNILKCICKSCGRVLLEETDRKLFLSKMRDVNAVPRQKTALLKKIREKCKKVCPWCKSINGTVKKGRTALAFDYDLSKIIDKSRDEINAAYSDSKRKNMIVEHALSPLHVLSLFKKMIDEDCELLNISDRPEKLIVTSIAVPPAPIRPSALVDAGKASNEDGLTSILKAIIRVNSILREDLESGIPAFKYMETWSLLQLSVVEYINSESPFVQDSKNRGLIQRLKGKQGRFRGNLSGKRTEFTGRTVISPDPNLKITEVAIPVLMAKVLTYPERVSSYNIEKLKQRVRNGPDKHPGAYAYIGLDGSKHLLDRVDKKTAANEMKIGYTVERHLEDGDIVLFNRQPSLHRMSLMCHRARIMPWRTLRFNESVCNPYNADFDGDEMNLHVPQSEEARTEALMLMGVQNNLCTPKNGEILVASTQDFLTSSFLITRKDTFYDRGAFALMCSYMGDGMDSIDLPTPAVLKPIEVWTGKQLFNVLLRPNASTRVFLNLIVQEERGSKHMDPGDGYVYFRNSELICGQLGKATLGNGNKEGLFSVLLRDYNSHAAASCMNRLAKLSARWIGNHGFSIGIDDVQPDRDLVRKKEDMISKGYNECEDLVSSYRKGELAPLPGCDAAQTLEQKVTGILNFIRDNGGKVCMKGLHWRNSPLIMSQCGSKGSATNICQMIVCVGQQSVGGRRAQNGFINRTLPHFPINLTTPAAKGFVANSFYSGLTPTEFFFHTMGGREGLVDTAVKTADTGYMSRRLMKGLEDLSIFYDHTVRNASGDIVQFLYGGDGMDPAKMEGNDGISLNLDQLFMKVKATCPLKVDDTLLSPKDILPFMRDRLSKCEGAKGYGSFKALDKLLSKFLQRREAALRETRKALQLNDDHLEGIDYNACERVAASISGISAKQLEVFLDTCIWRYNLKRVEAGTSIGAIGGQSIGEPGTQMTLKTFHFAGVASMNVTLGVPRIKEIIAAAKNIHTPIVTARLLSDDDDISARIVKSSIEKTVLGEVAKVVKIVLKSSLPYISVKLDSERIRKMLLTISADTVRYSILNHPKIKLKFDQIKPIAADKLKIYLSDVDGKKLKFELNSLKATLPKVIVKGIPTIERAIVNKVENGKKQFIHYKVLAEGTNLLAVMGTPGVDANITKSNNVLEIQQTLGIEAARQCIIDEIQETMSSYKMRIDIRHMMLLADLMTSMGEVLGITRFGISKMRDSTLMLASFEKTGEHLFNASYDGREDKIQGVSECIIMGIPMKLGTGILGVQQRTQKLPEFKYEADPILG